MAARRRSVAVEFTPKQLDATILAIEYAVLGMKDDIARDGSAAWSLAEIFDVDEICAALVAIRDAS